MYDALHQQNAVAAIRVSSTKQGTEGDSPEAQREQIERFAANRNIQVKKIFLFLESASKEQQPMQEAIDYCKDPKHGIQLFIVKSIDRFTRGGSYSYSNLKRQLEDCNVHLMDIYGIIGSQKVNTLEHLGVSYGWSVYDPTKNSEILEAERASDEKRDIMSRMIGAEIRYTRLGYWNRQAPLGYINRKVETIHGKRTILEPHPIESQWITTMFELRNRGNISDHQIARTLNNLGFRTRIVYKRDKNNPMRIISKRGGRKLTAKRMWHYLRNPLYAGVNNEVWLPEPIKCKFDGLISYDLFNRANRGRIAIHEQNGSLEVVVTKTMLHEAVKSNPAYPYRRVVACPLCRMPLLGSASRGRNGKYYPAYHCGKRLTGPKHYFRVTVAQLDEAVDAFVDRASIKQLCVPTLIEAVMAEWQKRQTERKTHTNIRKVQVKDLRMQANLIVERIRYCVPETIPYLEAELRRTEAKIAAMTTELPSKESQAPNDALIKAYASYFAAQPRQLLFNEGNAEDKARYFGLLFEALPTYEEVASCTPRDWMDSLRSAGKTKPSNA